MRRIDVHQHMIHPAYAGWLRSTGVRDAGGRALPAWSVDEALELMDGRDLATAILSVSTPGVHLAPGRGRDPVARGRRRAIDRGNAEALFPRFAQEERP